jgi:hypothetical protein
MQDSHTSRCGRSHRVCRVQLGAESNEPNAVASQTASPRATQARTDAKFKASTHVSAVECAARPGYAAGLHVAGLSVEAV